MHHRFEDPDGLDPELNWQSPVPPFTKWETECRICGISWNYVPALKKHFVNHWECECFMPTLVMCIIYSSLAVYFLCELRPLPEVFGWKTSLYLTVTAVLFGYSYVMTILTGPGYLPYYYPLKNPNVQGENEGECLSGMVTNDDQMFYVKQTKLPSRTGYFKSSRRIVIRPDHFCQWTSSFIGKKNHKLFFHFNMWGMFYTTVFTVCSLVAIVKLAPNDKRILEIIIDIVYVILGFLFALLTGSFVFSMLCEITKNETVFESMSHKAKSSLPKRERSCLHNWEEVFGVHQKMYLWLVPTPAFSVRDDSELIDCCEFGEETEPLL